MNNQKDTSPNQNEVKSKSEALSKLKKDKKKIRQDAEVLAKKLNDL